jgi:acetyl-CoA carboxylase biotin carboxyl carrier protein
LLLDASAAASLFSRSNSEMTKQCRDAATAFLLNELLAKRRPENGRKSVDLKDIKAIIDLMKKNSISEFELERQDFKIKLKRGAVNASGEEIPTQVYLPPIAALPATVTAVPAAPSSISTTAPVAATSNELEIKSPMIGTFYRSPSPEAGSYVEIGTEVNPDTVVCIIEAMKVMNEIKAEVKGVVTQILVESAKPVEFGQPMFKVRPL